MARLIIDAAVGLGTLIIAALAIWGPFIRSKLSPPKLIVKPHNLRGAPTVWCGQRAIYYHLKVVNLRPWLSVSNCQVLLTAISKKGPDGKFRSVPMPVPFQLIWAPQEEHPQKQITITIDQVFDFGRLLENGRFEPLRYVSSHDFQGFVEKGETVRYSLEVRATDFAAPRPQVFQVAWDGRWSYEVEKMETYLVITEICADSWC